MKNLARSSFVLTLSWLLLASWFPSSSVAQVPIPLSGDQTLTGRVVDERGEPMPGVLVRATITDPDHPRSSALVMRELLGVWWDVGEPEDEAIDDVMARIESAIRAERERRRETRTNEHGEYRFDALPLLPVDLAAYSATHRFGRITRKLPSFHGANFEGERLVPIHVDVRLSDGSVPKWARVTIENAEGPSTSASPHPWSPRKPVIHVRPGSKLFTVEAPGPERVAGIEEHIHEHSIRVPVEAVVDGGDGRVEIQCERRGSLCVWMERPLIQGLNDFVYVQPVPEGAVREFKDPPRASSRSLERGYQLFQDLDPGRYAVIHRSQTTYANKQPTVLGYVEVEAGVNEVRFSQPRLSDEEALDVHVADPAGRPVRSCWLSSIPLDEPGGSFRGPRKGIVSRFTDDHYRVRRERVFSLKEQGVERYDLRLRSSQFGWKRRTIDLEADEVHFEFQAPTSVRLSYPERAIDEWSVQLSMLDFGEPWLLQSKNLLERSLTLQPLQPGRYRVEARPWSAKPRGRNETSAERLGTHHREGKPLFEVPSLEFEVDGSAAELLFELPELFTLELIVPKRLNGKSFLLERHVEDERREGRGHLTTGLQSVTHLEAGTYRLEIDGESIEVTVPCASVEL